MCRTRTCRYRVAEICVGKLVPRCIGSDLNSVGGAGLERSVAVIPSGGALPVPTDGEVLNGRLIKRVIGSSGLNITGAVKHAWLAMLP